MEKWVEERHSYSGVIASYGGWVVVCDLPFSLWNHDTFDLIGKKTQSFENLFEARLKVRGYECGFLPVILELEVAGFSIKVRLKPLSRSVRKKEDHRQWICRQDFLGSPSGGSGKDEKLEGTGLIRGKHDRTRQLDCSKSNYAGIEEVPDNQSNDSVLGALGKEGRKEIQGVGLGNGLNNDLA
ncbi:hypothetical protein CsSME_00024801 [Camellia sinensis var. sinensis]